ncbi:hypothetical protein KUCAC02_025362 [Chaenocephalus aceratus]|uniref:Uncharacterized protein n=1 Tax=Chaenocephalus aceratus TaxID=36190 RepID=A0ACB9VTU8_CHAAC|nr:hypothetical protein KUCAC02_025362 [Chaenocephalus aceratus]
MLMWYKADANGVKGVFMEQVSFDNALPPTQTLSPWRRPQANGEQGAPEWALDWPLSGPTAESLYLHSL